LFPLKMTTDFSSHTSKLPSAPLKRCAFAWVCAIIVFNHTPSMEEVLSNKVFGIWLRCPYPPGQPPVEILTIKPQKPILTVIRYA